MSADEIVRMLREQAAEYDRRGYSGEASERYEIIDLIESLQAELADEKITSQSLRNAANGYKARFEAETRRADAAVECIEKIDDWNNHFCYHDLEEIIDEWRGAKEERK